MARKKQQPLRTQGWILDQLRRGKVDSEDVGLTYAECHTFGWTSASAVENAIRREFPDLSKSGVTRRWNVIWEKVSPVIHPSNADRIEGSLWEVKHYDKAEYPGMPPRPSAWRIWDKPFNASGQTVGYVSAATLEEARQIAQYSLGPLVTNGQVEVSRKGPDGWKAAKMNRELASEDIRRRALDARQRIEMLKWEMDQWETLQAFLEG